MVGDAPMPHALHALRASQQPATRTGDDLHRIEIELEIVEAFQTPRPAIISIPLNLL
jgi:hypothetical protein